MKLTSRTQEAIISLVESILAFAALVAFLALFVGHVLTAVCTADWRWLGSLPLILIFLTGMLTLLWLLLWVIINKSGELALQLNLPNGPLGWLAVVSLLMLPFALVYLGFMAAGLSPFSRELIDLCRDR